MGSLAGSMARHAAGRARPQRRPGGARRRSGAPRTPMHAGRILGCHGRRAVDARQVRYRRETTLRGSTVNTVTDSAMTQRNAGSTRSATRDSVSVDG